jgi:DNA-binding PadR family transcriptional regulator
MANSRSDHWATRPRCDDVGVIRSTEEQLLLGEWACLGILYPAPTHGFAIAARLKPGGDVGRVWSLSRPLTYRSLDQLTSRGYVHAVAEEPGIAGGNRTILAATRSGRAQLRKWLNTPVAHLRDLRSELLLKLIIADLCEIDVTRMLDEQYEHIGQLAKALGGQIDDDASVDVVALWRRELSQAALRFLDRLPSRVAPTSSARHAAGSQT